MNNFDYAIEFSMKKYPYNQIFVNGGAKQWAPTRLGTNLVRGSRFGLFWVVREVRGSVLEDEPRFGRFEVRNFQVRSNTKWKIYPFFDILWSKNLWFGSRFSLFREVRRFKVRRFKLWFQRTNLGLEGLKFSFLRFEKFEVWYFQVCSKYNLFVENFFCN